MARSRTVASGIRARPWPESGRAGGRIVELTEARGGAGQASADEGAVEAIVRVISIAVGLDTSTSAITVLGCTG